ncbi:unnamed protein product [Allacma fusca]|uniref:Etoposide-induced protein 2.4 homolog n=1 Tax=Allacma fusca TaxID=39272 RepID=A0A8J2PK64_9HEXA|nr:unnamed protein product [Allacma fusca]
MSIQQVSISIAQGCLDSLKGIYKLFILDSRQREFHSQRTQGKFQELRKKPSPIHSHSSTKEEPRLLHRVAHCCGLNGVVFGFSMIVFNHLILPCLQIILATIFGYESSSTWYWLKYLLHLTFDSLWVLPLFFLSRIVNALWFQDISTLAYRYSVGRPKGLASLSTILADNLFSFIIQLLFLVQAWLVSLVPLYGVADGLYIFHMCLLYSLYSFEYKWIHMAGMKRNRSITSTADVCSCSPSSWVFPTLSSASPCLHGIQRELGRNQHSRSLPCKVSSREYGSSKRP